MPEQRTPLKRAYIKTSLLALLLSMIIPMYGQDGQEKLLFSGSLTANTNGIATIPAFTLDKPAIVGILSLKKKKFSVDQYIAYSTQGKPWFFESFFNYGWIDSQRLSFTTTAMWGGTYTYGRELIEGTSQETMDYQRYVFLIPSISHKIGPNRSITLTTQHGYGFPEGSIKWATFITLVGNIEHIPLGKSLYTSLYPQLLSTNFDWKTDGFFLAGKFGVGHKDLPFFLYTRFSQYIDGNIFPDPGFKWNICITYSF